MDEIREPLRTFAYAMEVKLCEHDEDRGERGWEGDAASALFERVRDETRELFDALRRCDPEQAMVECVDAANFLMMIYDVLWEQRTKRMVSGGAAGGLENGSE